MNIKLKNGKLKEISREEYEDIKSISRMMTCLKDGEDMMIQYLGLSDTRSNRQIAYNVLMAVINDYKYFKII